MLYLEVVAWREVLHSGIEGIHGELLGGKVHSGEQLE